MKLDHGQRYKVARHITTDWLEMARRFYKLDLPIPPCSPEYQFSESYIFRAIEEMQSDGFLPGDLIPSRYAGRTIRKMVLDRVHRNLKIPGNADLLEWLNNKWGSMPLEESKGLAGSMVRRNHERNQMETVAGG